MSVVFIPGGDVQLMQVESADIGQRFADESSGYFLTAASNFSTELTNKERIALYNALIEFPPVRNALRSEGKEDLKPVTKFENASSASKRLTKLVGLVPLYENGTAESDADAEKPDADDVPSEDGNVYRPKDEPVFGIVSGEGFPEGEPVSAEPFEQPDTRETGDEPEPESSDEPEPELAPEPMSEPKKRRGRKPKAGPKAEPKKRGPNGPRAPKNVYHAAAPNVIEVRAGSMQASMLELLNRPGGVRIDAFIADCNANMRGKTPWSTSNTWGWLVYLLKDLKGWGLERRDGRLYAFRNEREREEILAQPNDIAEQQEEAA